MDYLRQFVIHFGGLKLGVHHFRFEIDDLFFEHFEHSEIRKGNFIVDISLEREEKVLNFFFRISGKAEVLCDRCCEPFNLDINGTDRLIVKFGDSYREENEEVQIIPFGENQFDLGPFIYEYIHLLVPVKRVHPDDENGISLCDPEILKRIGEREPASQIDSRWEVLKKLRTKN